MEQQEELKDSIVLFGSEARTKLYAGIKIAADAVGATMGPRGKTVLIQSKGGAPILTKDGVTVSKSIKPKDPVERMGAQLILEAASRTNDTAGDGTTTSTVLANALIYEGMKLLEAGFSAKKLVEGIEIAENTVQASVKSLSKKTDTRAQMEHVARISANGDTSVGKIIADAMEKVGPDGVVTVEDAKGMSTTLDHVEGLQFDRGYLSPYFATNTDKMVTVYNDVSVLVTDKKISVLKDILPVLEDASRTNSSLLIIAEDVEGEALQSLILNKVKAGLKVVAIRAPGYGPAREKLLHDICVVTGTELASSKTGISLEKLKITNLGRAKRIVVDGKCTTLVGTGATTQKVAEHTASLKQQLSDVTLSPAEYNLLRERIARLSGGVAIIKVGGSTEVEMLERKYRIEDALHATRAAAEEGIVPGGGLALVRSISSLDSLEQSDPEIRAGIDAVRRACSYPFRKILSNAGSSPDVVHQKLSESTENGLWWGYDASKGTYVDMMQAGVIDPAKVTRMALQNAASIAKSFLTLEAVIAEVSQ